MSNEDGWVFDSLVCFLHGPVWNAPLLTFIDEKSIVFDPNLQTDEHSSAVEKAYEDYKNLVDCMLGSYMEEMQITPEQFELACIEGQQQHENPFSLHQGLFQQIWAANDIKMFVRMMTQRNVELQLQALDLIERNQLPRLQDGEPEDDKISSTTAEAKQNTASDVSTDKWHGGEEILAVSADRELVGSSGASKSDVVDKFQRLNLFFEQNPKVTAEDVQSRQEYLRQQRDKILDIKKKTRARQLLEVMPPAGRSSEDGAGKEDERRALTLRRPSSAQVAQHLLETGVMMENLKGDDHGDNAALQLRKTLAKRLKSEVVEQQ